MTILPIIVQTDHGENQNAWVAELVDARDLKAYTTLFQVPFYFNNLLNLFRITMGSYRSILAKILPFPRFSLAIL